MECCQNANRSGMVHRKRKRSKEGYSLGVLPGVRQDHPEFMTGWILTRSFLVIPSGILTRSGRDIRKNVRRGRLHVWVKGFPVSE